MTTFIGPGGRLYCDSPNGWRLWAIDNATGIGTLVEEGSEPLERVKTDADDPGPSKTLCLTPK